MARANPRIHTIWRELSDADWAQFQELAANRKTTITSLHAFVRERGYSFSRSAVGRSRHKLRCARGLGSMCADLVGCSDEALRIRISESIAGLSGRDLGIVTVLAQSLGIASKTG